MKVSTLIKQLQKLDLNAKVYLSIDEEGNAFYAISKDFLIETGAVVIFPDQGKEFTPKEEGENV